MATGPIITPCSQPTQPRLSLLAANGANSFCSEPPPHLRRLLYTSRATAPEQCNAAFLRDLQQRSEVHNRRDSITGFLAYGAPFFFQVIEGPPDSVSCVFRRIMADVRHTDCVTILDVACAERLYYGWALKVSDVHSIALHPTIATVLSRFGASFIAMWPYLPGNAATLLMQGKNPTSEAPANLMAVTSFIHLVEFSSIVKQSTLTDFLPEILSLFIDVCTQHVREGGGQVAKFVGGLCMAYWPAGRAADAIAAIRRISTRFQALRETEPDWSPLSLLYTAAGVHFGGALLCNAGQQKSDFTLLGDSVNTTARIAALALQRGCPLLLSGAVAAWLGPRPGLQSFGTHALRGREGSVECFHFNDVEIPIPTLRHAIRCFSSSTSLGWYGPRQAVRSYADLPVAETPPLFGEPTASGGRSPATPSLFHRTTSWLWKAPACSEDLITLTYISCTTSSFPSGDVQAALQGAKAHHQRAAITSCLLVFRGAVEQTLEGPPTAVLPAWRRLRADRWLTDTVMVHMAPLEQRRHADPLQVLYVTDDMLADFPALPDVLSQLCRSLLCLETYVPSVVVRHIAAGGNPRTLQPVMVPVAILAADICSFTSLSERWALQGVWHLCNSFAEICTSATIVNGGEVLKLIGDCVIAFFPSFSLEAAVAAAESIVLNCKQVRRQHIAEQDLDSRTFMWAGVGLDWGQVLVAPCGSLGTADLTVTGEVASRVVAVEAATRDVGCAVVASECFVSRLPASDERFGPTPRTLDGVALHRRQGVDWVLNPTEIRQRICQVGRFARLRCGVAGVPAPPAPKLPPSPSSP
eukprot:EG_transcript_3619